MATVCAVLYVANNFRINTDVNALFDPNLSWKQDEQRFNELFPQRNDTILAVIDGQTPETVDRFLTVIDSEIRASMKLFQPSSFLSTMNYFKQHALLYENMNELSGFEQNMEKRKALFLALAHQPTLQQLVRTLSYAIQHEPMNEFTTNDVTPIIKAVASTTESVLDGENKELSWQSLFNGGQVQSSSRAIVSLNPVVQYGALQPGKLPTDFLRKLVTNYNSIHGDKVSMKLTGSIPISDDEFASLSNDAVLNHGLMIIVIIVLLYLALRSVRMVSAVLLTTVAGLALTTALGILIYGALNPISIAFAALFIGLGIDFCIQFGVRYLKDYSAVRETNRALECCYNYVGFPLFLAASSLCIGFFSFYPTQFRGVSELGMIAGLGMIIAYSLTLTLFPALLSFFHPEPSNSPKLPHSLDHIDQWLHKRRWKIIAASLIVSLFSLPLLWKLSFDADPMHLRDQTMESTKTFYLLKQSPETDPDVFNVLVNNKDEAERMKAHFSTFPDVAQVMTLSSYLPDEQERKLKKIHGIRSELVTLLNLPERTTLNSSNLGSTEDNQHFVQLLRTHNLGLEADIFQRLFKSAPDQQHKVESALFTNFPKIIEALKLMLSPSPVTQQSLPKDFLQEWMTTEGHYRVEIHPSTHDDAKLKMLTQRIRSCDPHATGTFISILESSHTVLAAFSTAGAIAFLAIFLLLWAILQSFRDVAMTMIPLFLATLWTLAFMRLLGLSLNFANIIAMPLMLAVGVAFHIYYIVAWRRKQINVLTSSLTYAILFSALTTGSAFGLLVLSSYPSIRSMGQVLLISLMFTMFVAFFIIPAYLGPIRNKEQG